MESTSRTRPNATRPVPKGKSFEALWRRFKNDPPAEFVYHDGDEWWTDEHLPTAYGTAEQLEKNRLLVASTLRNDVVPVRIVNRIFKDERVQAAAARGLTVGDICMIRGRAKLFEAMSDAENAMHAVDSAERKDAQKKRKPGQPAMLAPDSFGALCQRQEIQDLLAAYRTASLSRNGRPIIKNEVGIALECNGAKIFNGHERVALESTGLRRSMRALFDRLVRKYGTEIAHQVLDNAAFVDDLKDQKIEFHYGFHLARFDDERFRSFPDEKSGIEHQVKAWAEALPTTQFLEDHAAGCYLRGAITSDWQNGERHQSDARAAVMLASAGHHVVGQRGGRPLSDRERSNLLQVVEWIEHRCIHDRLESDAEVLDTLPWYVALHGQLDRGIVPPAKWLFEDLAEGVEGVRRLARPPQ